MFLIGLISLLISHSFAESFQFVVRETRINGELKSVVRIYDLESKTFFGLKFLTDARLNQTTQEGQWAESLRADLDRACHLLNEYLRILSSDSAVVCDSYPDFALVLDLEDSENAKKKTQREERRAYQHAANSALLIQAEPWDEASVKARMIHESVHTWLEGKFQSPWPQYNRWLEEGLADIVSFKTTRYLPRSHISKFLNDPTSEEEGAYGGILWWLAAHSSESREEFLKTLAEFHLGIRRSTDLIARKNLKWVPDLEKLNESRWPVGWFDRAQSTENTVRIRSTKFGIDHPAMFFSWHGPIPVFDSAN